MRCAGQSSKNRKATGSHRTGSRLSLWLRDRARPTGKAVTACRNYRNGWKTLTSSSLPMPPPGLSVPIDPRQANRHPPPRHRPTTTSRPPATWRAICFRSNSRPRRGCPRLPWLSGFRRWSRSSSWAATCTGRCNPKEAWAPGRRCLNSVHRHHPRRPPSPPPHRQPRRRQPHQRPRSLPRRSPRSRMLSRHPPYPAALRRNPLEPRVTLLPRLPRVPRLPPLKAASGWHRPPPGRTRLSITPCRPSNVGKPSGRATPGKRSCKPTAKVSMPCMAWQPLRCGKAEPRKQAITTSAPC